MGAYINLTNNINIAKESRTNGCIKTLGYKDIDDRMIKEIVNDRKIKWIQLSEFLTDEAYQIIDKILSLRPDIVLRLFNFLYDDKIDISFLLTMPHFTRLRFDCIDFKDNQQRINFDVLTKLRLKSFHIECFDLRDYEFIKYLSPDLEELVIMADTMGAGIKFDCSWLLRYRKLKSLWLGKKAKKNLEAKIENLNKIKQDNVVTFEELGIDKLFIDESHYFKNLYTYTKMSNVAGVQTSDSQKAADMYSKCRYIHDDRTGIDV